jgi:hypothetical protein
MQANVLPALPSSWHGIAADFLDPAQQTKALAGVTVFNARVRHSHFTGCLQYPLLCHLAI